MVNVSHATLTGAQLHEPKGIESAPLGTVYVSSGSGSGSWSNVGTSSFTGMIADFTWPVVQSGWLELDGSDINTTTYSALYNVMTIQMTGTRVSGSQIITSLSTTGNMRVGYYVFGTGISSGTTILSINSGTQITLSAAASSTGTATVVVSPWLLNTGTIRLPDVYNAGRYRRSRTVATAVGQLQADQNQAHTHAGTAFSGTTSLVSSDHTHAFSGITAAMSSNPVHSHTQTIPGGSAVGGGGAFGFDTAQYTTVATSAVNIDHSHAFSGNTGGISANHTHTYSGTTGATPSQGGTEVRPLSIVVMTCVKT